MPGVVFFGYGDLAVAGLDTLTTLQAPIAAVVVPGNRAGEPVDVIRHAAQRRRLPVLVQPPRSQAGPFAGELQRLAPDVILVWSYSMMLPPEVLAIPRHGAVNVHGGTLPEYRGGHVAQWAIINGEREFGVTLHYIDEGIDSGPTIAQRRVALDDNDDAISLREKMRDAGTALLREWWPRIMDGTAPRVPQDAAKARHWPMRTPEQGALRWTASAGDLSRLVRALRGNTPGAYVDAGGARLSLRKVSPCPPLTRDAAPGHVVAADAGGVRVATADGDLLIREAELDGRPVALGTVAALLRQG